MDGVRVVPGVGEAVRARAERLRLRFDFEPTLEERAWADARPRAHQELGRVLDRSPDPMASAVRLAIECASGLDFGPKSAPYAVVDRARATRRPACGDAPLVALALAAEQRAPAFVELVVDAYRLRDRRDGAEPIFRSLLDACDFKHACRFAVALGLGAELSPDELLLPLVLQDRLGLVDEMLRAAPSCAAPLVARLDGLLGPPEGGGAGEGARAFLAEVNVPGVKWSKLHHRPLGRLMLRLCAERGVPTELCANLRRNRARGSIRFLVRQRYDEAAIGAEAWADLVEDALRAEPALADELVRLLETRDPAEARRWAERFGVDAPSAGELPAEPRHRPPRRRRPPHPLGVPMSAVAFVDSAAAFEALVARHLASSTLVGIDSEWKPSFGVGPHRVSLVQIATAERVFVLDAIALSARGQTAPWTWLERNVLGAGGVTKVGFDLEGDMREIAASVPALAGVRRRGPDFVELSRLWRAALEAGAAPLGASAADVGGEGLGSLVERCFGTRLDKDEQCSNWESRPLRPSQLRYAAQDAHVLLELFDATRSLCETAGIDFADVLRKATRSSDRPKRRKPRRKKTPDT